METKARVLVWDFDGVLVPRSEFFKEEAWKSVFEEYEGMYEPFFDEANEMFAFGKGGDRYDILRHVYTRLGSSGEVLEGKVETGARQFNEHVQRKIKDSGPTPGATQVLTELNVRSVPMYVNSGTNTRALKESTDMLGLTEYFVDVLGAPTKKSENLMAIAKRESVGPAEIILLGDSHGDEFGAQEAGTRIVGLCNAWNGWKVGEKEFPLITELKEILDFF